MLLGGKVRLKPNKEQARLFNMFAGTARFAYNECLAFRKSAYETCQKIMTVQDCIAHIQHMKMFDDYSWIKDTPEAVTKQAIKDLDKAFKKFFKEKKGYPKFKKKGRCEHSFYQRTDNFRQIDQTHIKVTGIKKPVKCSKCKLPTKVVNTRIKFDGKYWYLTYTYEVSVSKSSLGSESLGVDLGIKSYAVCSDGTVYQNINKSETVKRLEKRKKRLQRQLSRKYEMNKQGNKYIKTKNILKLEQKLRLLDRRLANIRKTYVHTVTKQIISKKPKAIVLENLNVSGMMKNRHLSKAVQQQNFYRTREYLTYKGERYSVPVIIADRYFPSSKICNNCKSKNTRLRLSDRTFMCPKCGFTLDRDLNASYNLRDLA